MGHDLHARAAALERARSLGNALRLLAGRTQHAHAPQLVQLRGCPPLQHLQHHFQGAGCPKSESEVLRSDQLDLAHLHTEEHIDEKERGGRGQTEEERGSEAMWHGSGERGQDAGVEGGCHALGGGDSGEHFQGCSSAGSDSKVAQSFGRALKALALPPTEPPAFCDTFEGLYTCSSDGLANLRGTERGGGGGWRSKAGEEERTCSSDGLANLRGTLWRLAPMCQSLKAHECGVGVGAMVGGVSGVSGVGGGGAASTEKEVERGEEVWDDEAGVGGAVDRAIDLVCLLLSTGVCLVINMK